MLKSATRNRSNGVLLIFDPGTMKGIKLNTPATRTRYKYELEVVVQASATDLQKVAVREIPVEKARQAINKRFPELQIPRSIDYSQEFLEEFRILSLEESQEVYQILNAL